MRYLLVIRIIGILAVTALIFSGLGHFFGKKRANQAAKNQVAKTKAVEIARLAASRQQKQLKTLSPSIAASPSVDPSSWLSYSNTTYHFTITYPYHLPTADYADQPWEVREFPPNDANQSSGIIQGVDFGPPSSEEGGYLWGVNIYDKKKVTTDSLAKEVGDQFADRQENRKAITVSGQSAVLLAVTTKTLSNWVARVVIIEHGNNLYAVWDGALNNSQFERFYNSLNFSE